MSHPAISWLEEEEERRGSKFYDGYLDEVIVFPTDTVYGLLAPVNSEALYRRVYELKGRSFDKPLAQLVEYQGPMYEVVWRAFDEIQDWEARQQFEAGLLTVVLPEQMLPNWLLNKTRDKQLGSLGLRCPRHDVLQRLLSYQDTTGSVWATSVNRSGWPPATTAYEVEQWLEELEQLGIEPPEHVVLSRQGGSGNPSGVLDLSGPEPRRLR